MITYCNSFLLKNCEAKPLLDIRHCRTCRLPDGRQGKAGELDIYSYTFTPFISHNLHFCPPIKLSLIGSTYTIYHHYMF